jgi:glycosyltransferase involved in cell wall biosynthesis
MRLTQGGAALCFFLWLRQGGQHRIVVQPASSARPPKIVMLVVTVLTQDSRVERAARVLAANGFDVTIICPAWWRAHTGDQVKPAWGPGIQFRFLPQRTSRFAHYFPYVFSFAMLRAALREESWAYHAHDLTTAFLGLIAAALKHVACVCDFHEWYAENVTYHERSQSYKSHPPLKRRLFAALEHLTLHTATAVITVSESIGESLEKRYRAPKPVHIIRNIPFIRHRERVPTEPEYEDLHMTLGIAADTLIILYQGGLGPSRNLEPVIKAMASVPRAVLILRGPGHDVYGAAYQALAQQVGIGDTVYCLAPVPSARVVEEAKAGDVGLWTLLANVGLNFHYALGNKIFEYLAAGLPLLVADLPEARRLVERYQVGLCFDPDSPTAIAAVINRMVEDQRFRETCKANIPRALDALRADQEWDKLVGVYRRL